MGIVGEMGMAAGEAVAAKVAEEVARKLGKKLGGEAGFAAGRAAGAKAAISAAKAEVARVDAMTIDSAAVEQLKGKVIEVAKDTGGKEGASAGTEAASSHVRVVAAKRGEEEGSKFGL